MFYMSNRRKAFLRECGKASLLLVMIAAVLVMFANGVIMVN